jgi:type I restriction enzyme S subunit
MRCLVAISEVAEVNPVFPRTSKFAEESLVSFLPMAAVSESGKIINQDERPFGEVSKGYTYFAEGDVLMAKITPCMENGKATFVQNLKHPAGFGSTELHVLRPGVEVDGKYLFYMIWNPMFRKVAERSMTGTAGQKRVPSSFLKDYKIPLPPLVEQKRIAAILDKADSIWRKRQEAVLLTEGLLRSVFLDMFGDPVTNPKGWTVVKLKDTFELKPQIGTIVPAEERGKQLVVRVGELGKVDVALDRCKSVTLSGQELKRFYLSSGDFLLARAIGSADHLGKASIFQETSAPVVFDSHVMRLRFKNNVIHSTFFYEWLKSTGGKALFMRRAGQTAVQFNVNSEQIGEIEIPLPPYLTQMKFVALFEKVRKLYQKTNCTLEGSTQLFNSLLQRAFKGEL